MGDVTYVPDVTLKTVYNKTLNVYYHHETNFFLMFYKTCFIALRKR